MRQPLPCFLPTPFTLTPFADSQSEVRGTIVRSAHSLSVCYLLQAPRLLLAPREIATERKRLDGLWQATCFEFFLGVTGKQNYWEINLAPGGNWNCYAFSGYRQGMREEKKITDLPSTTLQLNPSTIATGLTLDLTALGLVNQQLLLAVSTVVLLADGRLSYFALKHPTEKPDFHHPDSYSLTLLPP